MENNMNIPLQNGGHQNLFTIDEEEHPKNDNDTKMYKNQDQTASDSNLFKTKKKKHRKKLYRKKKSFQPLSKQIQSPQVENLSNDNNEIEEINSKQEEDSLLHDQPLSSFKKLNIQRPLSISHHPMQQQYNSGSSSPMSFSEYSSLNANSSSISLGSLFEFKSTDHHQETRFSHPNGGQQIIKNFVRKVNSDFPYSQKKQRSRKSYLIKSIIESLPECVEEEKIEDEEEKYQRQSRFSVMMDHNEFGRQGGRHRSFDGVKRRRHLTVKNYQYNQSQYVSETEEEQYSDDSDKRNKKKSGRGIKIFSLGYFSQLMNKKIYSDDFDMSSEFKLLRRNKKNNRGSLMEYPINEDVESENQDDYLSDYSGSSNFSFQKRKMSLNLSKLIDKLEPQFDDSSSFMGSKNYFNSVNDPIEEEDDEEIQPAQLYSSSSFSKLKASHDKVNSFLFFTTKKKKIKSICLESEPILEELEEYQAQDIDQRNHTFIIPKRDRQDSMESGHSSGYGGLGSFNNQNAHHQAINVQQERVNIQIANHNLLPPIIEKQKDEDPDDDNEKNQNSPGEEEINLTN
ncbi:UNKNOWN [Stylonychia lemnae]|uniref:Uncharacterized protein n=1 Tax=Stylonychia lemnae TaxID=5949 RepID=A0A078A5G9_STYLE|nr:UNKNOWN [Stylonychia lemnae]|eukprot:CDW77419.1 UNKNOWN [Stylonychia lemnae]